MKRIRILLALALLAMGPSLALADYISQTEALTSTTAGFGGDVQIEAYDGVGAAGGGLSAGQVRLTFEQTKGASGKAGKGAASGLQAVAFNTDLTLSSGQISLPASWSLSKDTAFSSLGTFSYVGSTASKLQNPVTVLISGLGTNATANHFLTAYPGSVTAPSLPTADLFAAQWSPPGGGTAQTLFTAGPTETPPPTGLGGAPTPEPTSLALASCALGALLATRLRRRRNPTRSSGVVLATSDA
jgi:hypothetical protein